jgi:hypothetical protein
MLVLFVFSVVFIFLNLFIRAFKSNVASVASVASLDSLAIGSCSVLTLLKLTFFYPAVAVAVVVAVALAVVV